jgi:hypothetical protein
MCSAIRRIKKSVLFNDILLLLQILVPEEIYICREQSVMSHDYCLRQCCMAVKLEILMPINGIVVGRGGAANSARLGTMHQLKDFLSTVTSTESFSSSRLGLTEIWQLKTNQKAIGDL